MDLHEHQIAYYKSVLMYTALYCCILIHIPYVLNSIQNLGVEMSIPEIPGWSFGVQIHERWSYYWEIREHSCQH